jgi:hypothetical protein
MSVRSLSPCTRTSSPRASCVGVKAYNTEVEGQAALKTVLTFGSWAQGRHGGTEQRSNVVCQGQGWEVEACIEEHRCERHSSVSEVEGQPLFAATNRIQGSLIGSLLSHLPPPLCPFLCTETHMCVPSPPTCMPMANPMCAAMLRWYSAALMRPCLYARRRRRTSAWAQHTLEHKYVSHNRTHTPQKQGLAC